MQAYSKAHETRRKKAPEISTTTKMIRALLIKSKFMSRVEWRDVQQKATSDFSVFTKCFTWKRVLCFFVCPHRCRDDGVGFGAVSTTRSFSFDTFIFSHFFILLSSQLFFPLVRWCHTKYICFDVPFFGLSFACVLVFFVCFTRGIVFRLGHQFVCKS